jgi:hypothetical protein
MACADAVTAINTPAIAFSGFIFFLVGPHIGLPARFSMPCTLVGAVSGVLAYHLPLQDLKASSELVK